MKLNKPWNVHKLIAHIPRFELKNQFPIPLKKPARKKIPMGFGLLGFFGDTRHHYGHIDV